jgi:hypothetical protein
MQVIIGASMNHIGSSLSYRCAVMASTSLQRRKKLMPNTPEALADRRPNRMLIERAIDDAPPCDTGRLRTRMVPSTSSTSLRAEARSGAPRPRRSVTVNLAESPLGWLHARGLVSARQYDAGERLRADWTMAQLGPRVTMRWDPSPVARGRRAADAPLDPTLAGIAAKRRFDEAVATAGKGLSDILWRVVCDGCGLEAAETALGWPKRAGKLVLLMALDRVADYYRLP